MRTRSEILGGGSARPAPGQSRKCPKGERALLGHLLPGALRLRRVPLPQLTAAMNDNRPFECCDITPRMLTRRGLLQTVSAGFGWLAFQGLAATAAAAESHN